MEEVREEKHAEEEAVVKAEVVEVKEEKVATPAVEEEKPAPKKSAPRKPRTSLPNPTYVALKSLVYLAVARNSASVAAVQTRLIELGYIEAGGEKRGWFGPLTCQALLDFQRDESIDEEYCAGEQTVTALFAGTHVEVHNL